MKNPAYNYKDGRRAIFCPVCRGLFVKRRGGCCPFCGIRIAFGREFFTMDDIWMDRKGNSYRPVEKNGKIVLKEIDADDILFYVDVLFKEDDPFQ